MLRLRRRCLWLGRLRGHLLHRRLLHDLLLLRLVLWLVRRLLVLRLILRLVRWLLLHVWLLDHVLLLRPGLDRRLT